MDELAGLAVEILIILFRAFPGRFILVGGGALHWVFHSPRLSADIDLKPIEPAPRGLIHSMAQALGKKLPSFAAARGFSIACKADEKAQAVQILVDGRPVLRVELAPLAPVTGREKRLLQSDSLQSEIIVTPDIHQMLFSKAAAILKRPRVKGRDVFDIWFLQNQGAILDASAFSDWLKWEEQDSTDLEEKLRQITPSRLRADLARFLPESIEKSLAEEDYKLLINAARRLLQPFL